MRTTSPPCTPYVIQSLSARAADVVQRVATR